MNGTTYKYPIVLKYNLKDSTPVWETVRNPSEHRAIACQLTDDEYSFYVDSKATLDARMCVIKKDMETTYMIGHLPREFAKQLNSILDKVIKGEIKLSDMPAEYYKIRYHYIQQERSFPTYKEDMIAYMMGLILAYK